MLRLALLAFALPLALPAQTSADSTKPPTVRLFFRDGSRWDRAALLLPVGDTIVVQGWFSPNSPPTTERVTIASLARLEQQVPRSRKEGAKKGALAGAVLGLLGGAVISAPMFSYCDPDASSCLGPALFVVGSTVGAVVGTGVGAVVGSTRTSKWVCMPKAPCDSWPPIK